MVVPVGRIFSLIGFTLIDNVLPDVWADRGHGDHVDTILTQSFFPLRHDFFPQSVHCVGHWQLLGGMAFGILICHGDSYGSPYQSS